MIGHKMSRREMVDSYEYYDRLTRRARSHVRQTPGFTAGEEYRQYRRTKPSLLGDSAQEGVSHWIRRHQEDPAGIL